MGKKMGQTSTWNELKSLPFRVEWKNKERIKSFSTSSRKFGRTPGETSSDSDQGVLYLPTMYTISLDHL